MPRPSADRMPRSPGSPDDNVQEVLMVHRVFPWLSRSLTCAAAVALMAGCGGGGSPAAPGPSPTPVPTPTPAPTPTATPDPRANLANGPVVNYRIKVRSIAPCHDIEN